MARKLGDILTKDFKMDYSIIQEGLSKQSDIFSKGTIHKLIGEILLDDGLISSDILAEALSIQKGMIYRNYQELKPLVNFKLYKNPRLISAFGGKRTTLLKHIIGSGAVPLYIEAAEFSMDDSEVSGKDILYIGVTNPSSVDLNMLVSNLEYEFDVRQVFTSIILYHDFLLKYKELTKSELREFLNKFIAGSLKPEQFMQYLLIYAVVAEVSDIHIQPSSDNSARIGLRQYGDIDTLFYFPYKEYNQLISVIKNHSNVDSDTNVPHDGRLDGSASLADVKIEVNRVGEEETKNFYEINENLIEYKMPNVSFRVSTYPTESPQGAKLGSGGNSFEKVVLRVLNTSGGLVSAKSLGLSDQVIKELDFAKNRTQGIVFIVGPTGSGKSSTLYSVISSINAIERNVITFEDPVEIRQMLWSQGQRRYSDDGKHNFDYRDASKSILRQDPDIILMGEVRDEESASFAVESANTGHLVFTTTHANSSADLFERLKKLGVSNLEVASSITCVVSQRLLKRLCPKCKAKRAITEHEKNVLNRLEYNGPELKMVFDIVKSECK
ncbi:MAG: Flp pilus assembly complex ATPase component TadA, partial [Candidatus Scalindua sp.]|nr:Flp pilus assembly complex ATPase component TadA [Candidatus Scalindua sp.]